MELILFICTYFLLTLNVIGFGYFFAKNVSSYNRDSNIGYIGLYGIFFLTLISYLTNLVVKHGYLHNYLLLIFGIFYFIKFLLSFKNLKKNKDLKYLIFFLFLSVISILYFKSLDDPLFKKKQKFVKMVEICDMLGRINYVNHSDKKEDLMNDSDKS